MSKQLIDYNYLLTHAQLNDSLLQSYRQVHLTMQSIFVAIGAGLFIAVVAFDVLIQVVLATFTLIVLASISLFILDKVQKIIIARGEDVNFWHRRLILAEQDLPSEKRHFTEFKIDQQLRRFDVNYLKDIFLTDKRIKDDEVYRLVERGLGHTRKVLDKWLFRGVRIIWGLLLGISIAYTVYFYYCVYTK